jgi:hypothetical protein
MDEYISNLHPSLFYKTDQALGISFESKKPLNKKRYEFE